MAISLSATLSVVLGQHSISPASQVLFLKAEESMKNNRTSDLEYLIEEIPARLYDAMLDPVAVAKNPMGAILIKEVAAGRQTIDQLLANVRKLAIINPRLKRQPTSITTVSVTSNEARLR